MQPVPIEAVAKFWKMRDFNCEVFDSKCEEHVYGPKDVKCAQKIWSLINRGMLLSDVEKILPKKVCVYIAQSSRDFRTFVSKFPTLFYLAGPESSEVVRAAAPDMLTCDENNYVAREEHLNWHGDSTSTNSACSDDDDCSERHSPWFAECGNSQCLTECSSTNMVDAHVHYGGTPVSVLHSYDDAAVPGSEHAKAHAHQSIVVNTQEATIQREAAYAECNGTKDVGVQSGDADEMLLLRELNRQLSEKLNLIAWQKRCADEHVTVLKQQKNAVEEQLFILSHQKKDVDEKLDIASEQIGAQSSQIGAQGVLIQELQDCLWNKHDGTMIETVNPVTPPRHPRQQNKVPLSTLKWLDNDTPGNDDPPRPSHSQPRSRQWSYGDEDMAGSAHDSHSSGQKPIAICISQCTGKDSDGTWDAGDSNAQLQRARSNAWLAHDGPDEEVATLRLRGLPYRAKITDVMAFLGVYCQFLAPEDAITLVMNRDGRPSGLAMVRMQAAAAKRAQKELDRKMLGTRYVEVFGPLPYHRYKQQNQPSTRQKVANEIRAAI